MKIVLDTSSSNQEFINGLEELLESSYCVTTQIILHSEDECGIAADAIDDTAKRLGVEITWDKNVVLEDIPDIVDFVGPAACLYDQQALFGRIDMEIDELDGKLSYQKTREVLLAQIQSIDDHELRFS